MWNADEFGQLESGDTFNLEDKYRQLMHALPVAIYTCDEWGRILLYNKAAVELWGRKPKVKQDMWCGSWKIYYPDGTPLPLEKCPMAIALKEGLTVNQEIIIERPDGSRRNVIPYPKPLLNCKNEIEGAINMLLDITEKRIYETSKATLAAIVQSSEDAIISKTLEGVITSWNLGAEKLFGYSAEEMIGQQILKLIPDDRINEEEEILNKLRKGELVRHYETRRVTKFGKLLDISLTISPIKNDEGKIIGASKIARDITEQKLLHTKLIESEQRFRKIANSAPVMIWIANKEGECSFLNRNWLSFTGMSREQEIGKKWLEHIHGDDLSSFLNHFSKAETIWEDFSLDFRLRRHDGIYRWISCRAIPQISQKGILETFMGACMDITEMKEHDQRKDDFIKIASHELKTPVTSIKGYIQFLLQVSEKINNPVFADSLSIVDKQVSKLAKLINDMLDLSRIEGGFLVLEKETFCINDLAREVIKEMQLLLSSHSISLQEEHQYEIYADKSRISQVLINYINNAVKYSPAADKVTLRIYSEENEVFLEVEDHGIGIEKEHLENIFTKFYRAAGRNQEKTFPGFGIGLYIVNEIINNHGGKIYVHSKSGQGSVFGFSLPLHS